MITMEKVMVGVIEFGWGNGETFPPTRIDCLEASDQKRNRKQMNKIVF